MKFLKLGVFAMAMGLFVASCGSSTTDETETFPEEVEVTTTTETTTDVYSGETTVDTTDVDTTIVPAQ